MPQYSTKMIFAVLDVSLIMGLNIGETYKVFFTLINVSGDKLYLQYDWCIFSGLSILHFTLYVCL